MEIKGSLKFVCVFPLPHQVCAVPHQQIFLAWIDVSQLYRHPDTEVEKRLVRQMIELMCRNDAPQEAFERLELTPDFERLKVENG